MFRSNVRLALSAALALALGVAIAVQPAPAVAQVGPLSIINLGVSGNSPYPTGVNDDYQVVGNYYDASSVEHGFFWAPGIPAKAMVPAAVQLNGINNLDYAAGEYLSGAADYTALWLPESPYTGGFNAYLFVLGFLNAVTDDDTAAGVYSPGASTYDLALNYNDVTNSYAWTVSLDGVAYGAVPGGGGDVVGKAVNTPAWWSWSNGGQSIALPSTVTTPGQVNAVDGGYDMVGTATLAVIPKQQLPMFFYPDGVTQAQKLPLVRNTANGDALCINGVASMIGGNCNTEAAVWNGSFGYIAGLTVTDLNTLTGPRSGWHLQTVTGINSYGAMCGTGFFNHQHVGYLAIPTVLTSISVPTPIVANTKDGGTVTISNPAPFDLGVTVASFLSSVKFANGYYSESVMIPAGATSADFAVVVGSPASTQYGDIRANFGGWDVYQKLVVP